MTEPERQGTLYLVATPIGNLEDITLRALRVLKEADLVACEDTRQTQKLLNHFGIAGKTVSYHEHNEKERAPELLRRLHQGARIALVSDAGTPGISDPGYRLVVLAARDHIPIVPVPGAAAFVLALAASGLPTDSFRFHGFLPAKRGARRQQLQELRGASETLVFYETPHRIVEALEDVAEVLGGSRPVVVARELTKVHEEFLRGTAEEVLEQLRRRETVKGEITLLVGRSEAEAEEQPSAAAPSARARLEAIMREQGLDEKAALKLLARELGVSRSEAYRRVQQGR